MGPRAEASPVPSLIQAKPSPALIWTAQSASQGAAVILNLTNEVARATPIPNQWTFQTDGTLELVGSNPLLVLDIEGIQLQEGVGLLLNQPSVGRQVYQQWTLGGSGVVRNTSEPSLVVSAVTQVGASLRLANDDSGNPQQEWIVTPLGSSSSEVSKKPLSW